MIINKWYNVELKMNDAERLQQYLYDNNIKHEISGCFNMVHIEIFITDSYDYKIVAEFLKTL